MKTLCVVVLVVIALLASISTSSLQPTSAQGTCTPLDYRVPNYPPGVTVYTSLENLSGSLLDQTIVALENWNQALAQTGLDINFEWRVPPPFSSSRTLTIFEGVSPTNTAAEVINRTFDANGHIQTAQIRFDLGAGLINSAGQVEQAINPDTSSTIGIKVSQHEVGHVLGMGETSQGPCPSLGSTGAQQPGTTVMNRMCGPNDRENNMPTFVTPCDIARTTAIVNESIPQPTPEPEPEFDCYPYCTPILIDVNGDGHELTGPADGVAFNINAMGGAERTGWTVANSDDAWLALDRSRNGFIDNGAELFGSVTQQPRSANPNGFLALAEFDKPMNGGDGDGQITEIDKVFGDLVLWQDKNHNGISETNELHSLRSANITGLALDFKLSKKVDAFGNEFRLRAKVYGKPAGRWAWDVWLRQ